MKLTAIRKKKKNSKIPFSVTPQQLADYVFDDNPITVTEITKKLNSLIDTEEMKGIKTTNITNWLIKINMLEYLADENGKNHKIPTENGIQLGITRLLDLFRWRVCQDMILLLKVFHFRSS